MGRICLAMPWIHCFTCGLFFLSFVVQGLSSGFVFYHLPKPPFITAVPFGKDYAINCSTTGTNVTTSLLKLHSGSFKALPHPDIRNIQFKKDRDVFTLLDFGLPDAGRYKCRATDNTGTTIEWIIPLHLIAKLIKVPEMSVSPNKQVTVMQGENTNYTCQSVPETSLKWYKMDLFSKDIPIPLSRTTTIKTSKSTKVILMITNAQKSDSGSYKCVLTVGSQSKYDLASLIVYEPVSPKIISNTSIVNTTANQNINMECIVEAYPEPHVQWYKGDKVIKGCEISELSDCKGAKYINKTVTIETNKKYNATLRVIGVQYPIDHGIYHCEAKQSIGKTKADIFVNIQVKPKMSKRMATIIPASFNTFKNISCKVDESNPVPTWTWQYQQRICIEGKECKADPMNWKPLLKSHTVIPAQGTYSNTSTVMVPKKQDSSFYRCTATNHRGSDYFSMVLIRNAGKEVIKIIGSKIPQVHTAGLSPIRIECDLIQQFTFFGISWYKDDKPIDVQGRITQQKTSSPDSYYERFTLNITNITTNDTGNYSCETSASKNRATIKIIVKALVKPSIQGLISQDVKEESDFVELTCDTANANPPATITWFRGTSKHFKDSKINASNIGKGSLESGSGCDSRTQGYYFLQGKVGTPLVICKPKHPEYTHWYTCEAKNIAGVDRKSVQINILAKATIISPKSNQLLKVTLGNSLNITCTAKGNPIPSVAWTKTGSKEVLVSGKGTARLQFNEILEKNLGNYTCNATNYKSDVLQFSISEQNTDISAQTSDKGISKQALIGIICGCVAFVLLVSIICLFVYRRQKKQIEEYKELYFLRTGNSDYKIDPDRSLLDQCNDLPYDLDWEFPEERLILGKPLGSGAFGQVVKAEAIGMAAFKPRDKTPEALKNRSKLRRSMRESKKKNEYTSMRLSKTTVAVKTLKEGATQNDYKDLASELKILIHLGNHKNIVNILGACTRGRRLMVIIEFAPHGDLLSFLRERRDIYEPNWVKTSNNPDQDFTLVDIGMGAYQISRGMEFLASRKCVHRDLAARNVLVGQDYVMKISDFGLARDIYKDDLYVKTTSGLLPVKWMAMESLFDRVYTEKSDVWSFGIVLWEIFTLGGNPYPGLPTEQLLDYLSEGQRMKQPQNCPLEMYAIMRDCWMQYPDQRPDFRSIAERLGQILERNVSEDNPYIHLQMDEETGATNYYLNPCDTFNTRQTPDGYEEALPTPRPDTSKYDSPLPTLPPPDSPGYDDDAPTEPLPAIPPTYEEATKKRRHHDTREPSQCSNESGIGIDEKEKEREETEPLIVRLEDETRISPSKKGKHSTESTV